MSEGTIMDIKYEEDQHGHQYARCVYVHIPGSKLQSTGLPHKVVPILPVTTSFKYSNPNGLDFNVSCTQMPLLQAYVYTYYKCQGQSLTKVIMDLASSRSLQSIYVMLS